MGLYREEAVVLRTFRLGEADRIVVLFGVNRGKIRAVAKGVRKTKSRFGGRLEPTNRLALMLYEGRPGAAGGGRNHLEIITQAETVERFPAVRADLDRLAKASSLLEAVDGVSVERHGDRRLYAMLLGALRALAQANSALLVPAFFLKLLAGEGALGDLDTCSACGAPAGDFRHGGLDSGAVGFDFNHGGVLCPPCAGAVAAPVLSADALALMRRILGGALVSALAEGPSRTTAEVDRLATRSLEHHIERRLRSVALLD